MAIVALEITPVALGPHTANCEMNSNEESSSCKTQPINAPAN